MKNTEKQYRYPGTRPFTKDDRLLFFGRDQDIERLYEQIMVEKLLVLFGKSGLGKSSLLNAGVVPLLKEQNNFLVISMILGFARAENTTPAVFFLNKLAKLIDYNNFLWQKVASEYKDVWTNATLDECFWLACKSLQVQTPDQPIIFVLDQFEEIFTPKTDELNRFGYLLATLLHGQTPQTIKNNVIEKIKTDKTAFTKQELNVLFEPVDIKFVISTRSDKMSLLNRLKNHIPQILQKTYELHPLSIKQAKDALLRPAKAEGDFISSAFAYHADAENKIINYLSTNGTKQIETFQLQLICQFCEGIVIKEAANTSIVRNVERVINSTELGDLSTIFTRHYDKLIHDITDTDQQLAVRRLVEENMIIEGSRVPLPDKVITEKHKIPATLLQILVNSRLLRSEPNTVGGYSYEISHDTLVDPITVVYKIRFEKEEREKEEKRMAEEIEKLKQKQTQQRKIIIRVSGVAILALLLFVWALYNQYVATKSKNKVITLLKNYIPTENQENIFLFYYNIGIENYKQSNYKSAIENFNAAQISPDRIEDYHADTMLQNAEILLKMQDTAQSFFDKKDFRSAFMIYNNTLKINADDKFSAIRIKECSLSFPEMQVFVPGGGFWMGNNNGSDDEKPEHWVPMSDFYISRYEITNELYAAFLNSYKNDRMIKDGKYKDNIMIYENSIFGVVLTPDGWKAVDGFEQSPVIDVTWFGAYEFCSFYGLALPTEAQWEYAAKGGVKNPYIAKHVVDKITFSGSNNADSVAWYINDGFFTPQLVGKKHPNQLGIYDMSGNVWEWCMDWYQREFYAKSMKTQQFVCTNDYTGFRVIRGGVFSDVESICRTINRGGHPPDEIDKYLIGFRFVIN